MIAEKFRARNRSTEIVDLFRTEIPDFSEEAFREAVANAMTHRDYTALGAIHVQWTDQGIAISNPGGLPEGVRLDNLLTTSPRPRNPLLADAFKRAGIVERTGRGAPVRARTRPDHPARGGGAVQDLGSAGDSPAHPGRREAPGASPPREETRGPLRLARGEAGATAEMIGYAAVMLACIRTAPKYVRRSKRILRRALPGRRGR
jgi:hypothetical protein